MGGKLYRKASDGSIEAFVPSTDAGSVSYGETTVAEALDGMPTGVKGEAESAYRTGNVNLTCENIGAAAANHMHPNATADAAGMMSAADKAALDGRLTITKVWENASPTSSFAAQTVAVKLAITGQWYAIEYRASGTSDTATIAFSSVAGTTSAQIRSSGGNVLIRYATVSENGESVAFAAGYPDNSVNNARMIPIAIYDISGVLG